VVALQSGERLRRWFLLDGNRLSVAAVLLAVSFLVLGPFGHLVATGTPGLLAPAHDPSTLLVPLLSGVFLLVSIVVSINSLYVSQEQTPLGQQREQIEGAGRFREDVEALVGEPVSTTEPSRLLRLLSGTIVSQLQSLRGLAEDADVQADVDAYLEETATRNGTLNDRLGAATGVLDVVTATMDYQYNRQAIGLRRLRTDHGEELPDEAVSVIGSLLESLEQFAAAREYFKTVYFRREFATLSTRLTYVSLAAMLVLMFAIIHTESTLTIHLWVTLVQTVALAPFAVLSAYVVRAATVVRRTRASGQFGIE
jgi:membrane protein implicated in regulation of membrane protease activity